MAAILAAFVAFIACYLCEANQNLFIGNDGKFTAAAITPFLTKQLGENERVETMIAVVDCSSLIGESKLINEIYGTSFQSYSNGVALDFVRPQKAIVLRGCFDSMFSTSFCGIDEKEDAKEVYDQFFRRMLVELSKRDSNSINLKLVVDSSDGQDVNLVRRLLEEIWEEVKEDSVKELNLEVVWSQDPQCKGKLLSGLQPLQGGTDDEEVGTASAVTATLKNEWEKIPALLFPVLRRGEEVALYQIEEAYAASVLQADVALGQLTRRIGEGRFIVNYPQRIKRLVSSTLSHFHDQIRGNRLVRHRIERSQNLRTFIVTNAEKLFQQLVQIKELEHTKLFQRELVQVFKKYGLDSVAGSEEGAEEEGGKSKSAPSKRNPPLQEAMKQLVRRKSFDFTSSLKQIEDISLGFTVAEAVLKDFSEKLESIAAAFPESAEARLIELQAMEKQVAKPPRKGRKRSKKSFGGIGVSMSLVGMLRPPGYGNLQGFVGYGRPIFGIPVDFLLGIQNDGDSMEILADDREHPLLRVQPKFHFEVDFK